MDMIGSVALSRFLHLLLCRSRLHYKYHHNNYKHNNDTNNKSNMTSSIRTSTISTAFLLFPASGS